MWGYICYKDFYGLYSQTDLINLYNNSPNIIKYNNTNIKNVIDELIKNYNNSNEKKNNKLLIDILITNTGQIKNLFDTL